MHSGLVTQAASTWKASSALTKFIRLTHDSPDFRMWMTSKFLILKYIPSVFIQLQMFQWFVDLICLAEIWRSYQILSVRNPLDWCKLFIGNLVTDTFFGSRYVMNLVNYISNVMQIEELDHITLYSCFLWVLWEPGICISGGGQVTSKNALQYFDQFAFSLRAHSSSNNSSCFLLRRVL